MGRLGVSQETTVVVYDRASSLCASRLWWALTYYGHPDVHVLDGGLDAWTGAGLPVSAEPGVTAAAPFVPRPRPSCCAAATSSGGGSASRGSGRSTSALTPSTPAPTTGGTAAAAIFRAPSTSTGHGS